MMSPILVMILLLLGDLVACRTPGQPIRDVVADFVKAIKTSDPDLYRRCLDKDRYRYEGKLTSTSTTSYGFSYDEDVAALSRAFEAGYVIDSNSAIVSRDHDHAIVDLHFRFVNFRGSSGGSYGESYNIDSQLTVWFGKDRFGEIRIQSITETVPKSNEIRSSFGLIKFINSTLYEDRTEDVIETRIVDKKSGRILLRTKTTQSWSSEDPVMHSNFVMLDSSGNVISGVQ